MSPVHLLKYPQRYETPSYRSTEVAESSKVVWNGIRSIFTMSIISSQKCEGVHGPMKDVT